MTPETPKQMASVAVSTPAATRTILIVDDDPSVTETFERMLRLEGYHVVTALSAEAGLNQAEVAEQMGVSAPSVSSWETGRSRPKHGRMAQLAGILGVPATDLLDDAAPEDAQELIERSREEIAHAMGISVDRVRIFVEY